MTTYSGRHKEEDRLSARWNHQKIKKCTSRKPDSVISDSGYSSSNSKDSFIVSDHTHPTTSDFLQSPIAFDADSDQLLDKNTHITETLPEGEFRTSTSSNQHKNDSTIPNFKQSESNNCVKLDSVQHSTDIQSTSKQQTNVQNGGPIKPNRLSCGEDDQRKQKRFNRTAKALRDSGLLPIAIQTGHLLKKNLFLQKEIDKLKKEAELFVQSLDVQENMSENTASSSGSE